MSESLIENRPQIPQSLGETDLRNYLSQRDIVLSDEELEHCRLIEVPDGVPILIIDREHDEWEGGDDPLLAKCLGSPSCKEFIPEYFLPDLKRDEDKYPDFVKKLMGFSADDTNAAYEKRGGFFYYHAQKFMGVEGKKVSVVDIANTGLYEAYFSLWPAVYSLTGSALPLPPTLKIITVLAPWVMRAINYIGDGQKVGDQKTNENGRGIYDKRHINSYEKAIYDMEDARRVYAARALEKLSNDRKKQYPNNDQLLVAVYPKAHAMRIANYLTNLNPSTAISTQVKNLLYRYPGLEFSTRTYEKKKSYGSKPEGYWDLVENVKF
ncbi:MAG TPA: hypothetical protein PLV59_02170 [Candidatus Dojkabacteria bacterium]|nr:hypothetical protein [Candidatus Dojkabacteria bacterium]